MNYDDDADPKIYTKTKGFRTEKKFFSKTQGWRTHTSWFDLKLQNCTKTVWCWHKRYHTQELAQNDYKYLTVKAKSLKLLDENIRLNLHDLGFVNVFLNVV